MKPKTVASVIRTIAVVGTLVSLMASFPSCSRGVRESGTDLGRTEDDTGFGRSEEDAALDGGGDDTDLGKSEDDTGFDRADKEAYPTDPSAEGYGFGLTWRRELRSRQLLTQIQLQVSDGVWQWGAPGTGPYTGPNVMQEHGMDNDNSHHYAMDRYLQLDADEDVKQLTNLLANYFKEQGWESEMDLSDERTQNSATALTEDHYLVRWSMINENLASLDIMSKSYWGDAFLASIVDRVPPESWDIAESVPGVYIRFPSIADPLDYAPNLLDNPPA